MNRRIVGLGLAMALLLVPGLFAEKKDKEDPNTRMVQGAVMDVTGNPVEGAVVQIKNMKTLQVRSFITQKDGTYHFQGLNTNVDFELKALTSGAASPTRTLSTFDSRNKP